MTPTPADTKGLVAALASGDPSAFDALFARLHGELHAIAERKLRRERPGATLQPTALVNEAYIRLVGRRNAEFQDRAHFLAVAATVIRRLLTDRARRPGRPPGTLPDCVATGEGADPIDLLALDDALTELEESRSPRQAKVVELRFFAGLTEDEAAEVVGISSCQVRRDWQAARAWLFSKLAKPPPEEGSRRSTHKR